MGLTAKQLAVGLVLAGYSLTVACIGFLTSPAWAGLVAGIGLLVAGLLAVDVDRKAG